MTHAEDLRSQIGLLTPKEIATALQLSPHTLAIWRSTKKGPAYIKLGRAVFYRWDDVQQWVNGRLCVPEADVPAEAADAHAPEEATAF